MNSFTSTLNLEKKFGIDNQGNYIMKSVIAQGSSIAKAIEEALKKADMPQEFFVKVLEDAQAGFLGFGSKKAKIALFFKNDVVSEKVQKSMFDKGSYAGLFNNPEMKKQLDQQLKELGFEIKPLEVKKQEAVKSKPFNKEFKDTPLRTANLQIRPLGNKNLVQRELKPKSESLISSNESDLFKDHSDQDQSNSKQQNKHRKYYRYRRNRYKNRSQDGDQNTFNSNKLGASDKDE